MKKIPLINFNFCRKSCNDNGVKLLKKIGIWGKLDYTINVSWDTVENSLLTETHDIYTLRISSN